MFLIVSFFFFFFYSRVTTVTTPTSPVAVFSNDRRHHPLHARATAWRVAITVSLVGVETGERGVVTWAEGKNSVQRPPPPLRPPLPQMRSEYFISDHLIWRGCRSSQRDYWIFSELRLRFKPVGTRWKAPSRGGGLLLFTWRVRRGGGVQGALLPLRHFSGSDH